MTTYPESSTPGETAPSLSNQKPDRFSGNNRDSRDEIKKLIDWCNKQFSGCKGERSKFEQQWHLNYSFYRGKQNVIPRGSDSPYNTQFNLWTPPAPYYKARPVINKIRPIARREMAKLTSQKPSVSVIPASSDQDDMNAAQAAEQVWEYIYDHKNLASTIRRTVFWSVITGNGFMKCWWDDNEMDPATNEKGNLCYEAITPFHLFVPDLTCEDIEFQPFVLHAQLMKAEVLSKKFGTPVALNNDTKGMEDNYATMLGVQQWEKNHNVLAMEFWIKPGQFDILPEGGMVITAGNQMIDVVAGDPYTHGKYPFAHIGDIHNGQFYRDSIINDLIPLQREYNRTRGQIIEAKNRMSKPQMYIEKGSLSPSMITSEPGLILEGTPGFSPPILLQPRELPQYVENELIRIAADMDDISGQHDVSRGQTPSGVTAATAISYLQESDDTMLSYTYDSVEEGVEKIAKLTMAYVHDYWDTPRLVKVTGIDESFDTLMFKGSDIPSGTAIKVEGGSALPTMKAARQAFVMDLMNKGFIPPDKGLEIMDIGGIEQIYRQLKIDKSQADRENLMMRSVTEDVLAQYQQQSMQQLQQENAQNPMVRVDENGQLWDTSMTQQGMPPEPINPPLIVPVNSWDNHPIHIETHNNYRKGQAFAQLPTFAKDLFEQHVQGHMDAAYSDYVQQLQGAANPDMAAQQQQAPNAGGANQFSGIPAADEQASQYGQLGVDNGATPA